MWARGTASTLDQGQAAWTGSGWHRWEPILALSAVRDQERARRQAAARCEPSRGSFAPCFSCCPHIPPTRAPSPALLSSSRGWSNLESGEAHLG